MIYPDNFEDKTGFATLRRMVADSCVSTLGITWCEKMCFSSDFNTVRRDLLRTAEMLKAISMPDTISVAAIRDVTPHLRRIKAQGSYLEPAHLADLRGSLAAADAIGRFFRSSVVEGSDKPLFPELKSAFEPMQSFPVVIDDINSVISRHASVLDTASPELSDIRRSLQAVSSSMSGIMRRVIERNLADGTLDKDTTPSVRDGRLVIPVPAMMKRKLNGIVHDESATGKTVFIEPAEVVEANNRMRELQAREHREIVRILVALSDRIRPHLDDLLLTMDILGLFDFIRAKAIVARQFDAQMPFLDKKPCIEWYHAVHPVLHLSLKKQGREVVPLDIHLNREQRILVISGPNAGGKSVTLKTVGIVQYMLQCGMLPTAYSNSHFSVFRDILIDIGDEQSIENDLSTYSSHLRNMKKFLAVSSPSTLILIDEMGSGTEPHFGGALAQSILAKLNDMKVMGIVTTHYQNLKSYADTADGVVNGAMLYDRQKMRPLFQLSIGSPGSSFAIEIARNTGLPVDVIDSAKEIVGSDYVDADKYMLDIARDRRYWANKRLSIKEKEHKIQALLDSYEEKLGELKERRASIISQARNEATEILRNSNAALEKTILEIRKNQAEKERTKELRKELDEYKKSLDNADHDANLPGIAPLKVRGVKRKSDKKEEKTKAPKIADSKIEVGSVVKMEGGNSVGTILEIAGNKATVAFGALRTIVDVRKLRKSGAAMPSTPAAKSVVASSGASRERQLNFSREIDVRGFRVDEALQAVTYFLDDAVQFSAGQIRILHGTGTGALRVAIRQLLQAYPSVSQFHDEDVRFGGAGITVVHLN